MKKTIDFNDFAPTVKPLVRHDYLYTFTVFVPAYNAAKTIKNTLLSIEKQNFTDFEVLIVNDGSKDNTSEVINDYLKNTTLKVRFVDNAVNQHKVPVMMQAIDMANGEFFIVIDADDTFFHNGLEILKNEYDVIPEDLKPKISGVSSLIEDQDGNLVGDKFPKSPFYSNTLETKFIHNIDGDKEGFIKTDILKSIQFSDAIKDGGFYPLSMLWLTIAKLGYVTKYVNIYTYTYNLDIPNSITKVGYKVKSFGFAVYAVFFINNFYSTYFLKMPKEFIKRIVSMLIASLHLNYTKKSYFESIQNNQVKIVLFILWPFRKLLKRLV